jgi:hypothetical protein
MELIAEKTTIESTKATTGEAQREIASEARAKRDAVKELSSLQLALIGGGSTAPSLY